MKSTVKLFALLATTLVSAFALCGSAIGATVVNGDFSSGNLSGWTAYSQPGGPGQWVTYNGATTPVSGQAIAAPASGPAAIADMTGASTTILHQDVALESGFSHKLDLDFLADNRAPAWATPSPLTFDYVGGSKQHARIDILKASASATSVEATDVLQSIYASQVGDPLSTGWRHASVDLSPFAGQTVKIRIGNVNNNNFLFFAVDNVVIVSTDVTAPVITAFRTAKSKFKAKGRTAGSNVSFTADEAGVATVVVLQEAKGKRSGTRCVKPSKKLAKKKNCKRFVKLRGATTINAVPGANTFKFNGKVRRKPLKPGRYKLQLTLKNAAGLSSTSTSNTFKVTK